MKSKSKNKKAKEKKCPECGAYKGHSPRCSLMDEKCAKEMLAQYYDAWLGIETEHRKQTDGLYEQIKKKEKDVDYWRERYKEASKARNLSDFKLQFSPSEELVSFAKCFSDNWENLSCGQYKSDNGRYTIRYKEKLLDQKTNEELNTNVRVSNDSGIIDISKKRIIELNTNKDYLFFIIIWCIAQRTLKNHTEADIQTIQYYLTTGRSKMNMINNSFELFKTAPSELNRERMEKIINFIGLKEVNRKKMLRKLIS